MAALTLNEVILCGRLTADVELKSTGSGKSVAAFSLALNRPKANDGTEQKADFPPCVAWDKTAEFISKYFRKGDSICINGELRTRSYKDNSGRTVFVMEVYANKARFVDNKATAAAPATNAASRAAAPSFEDYADAYEDLPF
jgi:single-strand DNA-binding protein